MAEAQTGNDGQPVTLKEKIEMLQTQYGVNFVYDSSLRLDAPCGQGASLDGLSLEKVLEQLLTPAGIAWKRQREYVMLYPAEKKRAHYSVSGYVYQENGEPLINATVYDLFTGKGTLTNAYGFFSLTLPEGVRKLRFSFVGCEELVQEIDLHRHSPLAVTLKQSLQLEEVVIKADLNNPLATTQTGKVTLTPSQLNTEYALFSSPDLVKTLQNQAGVAAGMELISGMYVHGGTNDGNLFLLDGTPLYQVSHWGGLFSAFNTDIVKNVDFYKSGFPARYGGRLSSVTDVRTKEGDMKEFHGTFSLGLLDGRIQLEGPIVKNRTSFNIAMRRSWLELMTLPACGGR